MTFEQAKKGIFEVLRARGWGLKTDLSTPHATSPSGMLRLWFKPQAVYYTKLVPAIRHTLGDARTVSYNLDIRKADPAKLVDWIEKSFG